MLEVYKCSLIRENVIPYDDELTTANEVHKMLKNIGFTDNAEEVVMLICLNAKGKVIGLHEVSRGSLCYSVLEPREIFKRAVLNNANSIMLAHNHPSGDCSASDADIRSTKRLVEASAIMGIPLHDHIITGDDCYTSMRGKGMI